MFLFLVILGAVVLLGLAWVLTYRSDHRGTRKTKFISQQLNDESVSEARAWAARNNIPGPKGSL